jgi:hypothetical protein
MDAAGTSDGAVIMSANGMMRVLGVAAAMCGCIVSPASGDDGAPPHRVTLGFSAPAAGAAAASAVLPRSGLLVRLAVEPVGAPADAEWALSVVRGGAGEGVVLARLGHRHPVLEVPRPLGIEVSAGDVVRVEFEAWSADVAQFTLLLEYEAEAGEGRIPVRPVDAVAAGPAHGEWVIEPTVTGRLMALAGLRLDGGAELVLRDAGSGAVVWREVVPAADARGFAGSGSVVRVGVLLRQGHSYRLSITSGAGASPAAQAPLWLAAALPAERGR